MKVNDKKGKDCSGCTACMHICPVNAITMVENEEGFLYPKIDEAKCTNCGLCFKLCPFNEDWFDKNKKEEPEVYAIKNKNEYIRSVSTSGGVFSEIAEYVINKEGVVYGAAFDDNMVVKHIRVTTKRELEKLRGSKYVQSNLDNTFINVKEDLVSEKIVLFSGTPCQVAGLSTFLKKDYQNLITVDLVCHGVPSPMVFKDHIQNLEKTFKNKVKNYYFRSKIKGWHKHTESVTFEDGTTDSKSNYSQAYKYLFYENSLLRRSCNNCKYTNINRISDFTLGDYWGIEKKHKDFDDNKGVSLLLVNNQKAKKIFDEIKDNLIFIKTNTQDCLQTNLQRPTKESPMRNKIWNDYIEKGYKYIIKKYSCCGLKMRILIKLKEASPQKLKSIIKKFLNR